ncbi:hypothetical protein ABR39_17675 [Enterobacter genomosp. O]|nr:hypothetical protein ABR39_17675 [Enterobacter genomosp. O]
MAEGKQKGKEKIKKASKLLTSLCLSLDNLRDFVAIDLHFIAFLVAIADQTGIIVDFGFTVSQDHSPVFCRHNVIATTARYGKC